MCCLLGLSHRASYLESMLNDIDGSIGLTHEFNQAYKSRLDVYLNVSVCTTAAWPTFAVHLVNKPTEIRQACEQFAQFYRNKYCDRTLHFQMDTGLKTLIFDKKSRSPYFVPNFE